MIEVSWQWLQTGLRRKTSYFRTPFASWLEAMKNKLIEKELLELVMLPDHRVAIKV